MTRRARTWLVVAALFSLANAAGAGFAIAAGEMPHALLHVVVALATAIAAWWLAARFAGRDAVVPLAAHPRDPVADRLSQIEMAVDAVAIEAERISEGQRVVTQLLAEDAARAPAGRAEVAAHEAERATGEVPARGAP